MSQKVMRVGNSIGVTVPSQFVKTVGIRVGDSVKVKTILDLFTGIFYEGVNQAAVATNHNRNTLGDQLRKGRKPRNKPIRFVVV